MKFHTLAIEGFGAFADRQTIDFDAVAGDGLFLIAGPTGSGKTTILDAVTFALYGRVPGARQDADELRSKYAAPNAPTVVELEFSADGRRWRIERSPAYERPKLRGSGVTVQRPQVHLFEHKDGRWQPIASRDRQVGEVLAPVLGLSADQFTKIVLLPQGEFTAFLRADPAQREPLLRRLFGTERFRFVEEWFQDRAKAAGGELGSIMAGRVDLMKAASKHCPDPLEVPDDGQPAFADVASHISSARALVRDRLATVDWASADIDREVESQQRRADELRTAADDAERLRAHRALEEEDRSQESTVAEARTALEQLAAADKIMPSLREEKRARAAAQAAEQNTQTAQLRLKELIGEVDDLDSAEKTAADALRAVRSLRGSLQHRELLVKEDAHCRRDLAAAEDARARAQQAHEAASKAQAEARSAMDGAPDVERLHDAFERTAADADRTVQAHRRLERAKTAADAAREHLNSCEEAEAEARDHHRRVRELRLTSIAAELAEQLEQNRPCPVCGSAEHPSPAERTDADGSREAEQDAEAAAERARSAADAARRECSAAESEAAAAKASAADCAFDDPASAQSARTAAENALAEARDDRSARRRALQRADDQLAQAEEALRRAQESRDTASDRARTASSELAAAVQAQDDYLAPDIEAAGIDIPTTAEQASSAEEDLSARLRALEAVRTSKAEAARAAGELADRSEQFAQQLSESPFDDAAELEAAAAIDADALRRVVRAAEYRSQRLADNRAADWYARAQALPDEDYAAEEQRIRETVRARQQDARSLHEHRAVLTDRLNSLQELLDGFLAAGADEKARIDRLAEEVRLAALVRGTAQNSKLPLSSYALLGLFEAVTRSASERWSDMSNGRYRFEVRTESKRKESKAGLGLTVIDAFSDSARDARSLSGGESFMAALALALGLADTVAQTSGGLRLDTLFIDEGFGSLDPDSLDDVLTILDELRSGGRRLGVISHVESMQQAIPAKITVTPSQRGSSIAQTAGNSGEFPSASPI